MVSRTHFGMTLHGSYNGDIIGHRLIRCVNGFFIRVHFLSTPFLLSELYHSASLHAATLHTVTEYPSANDVRCSIVYIAGGYTLISSRVYERVDVHAKVVLTGGLHQRFPDLVDVNFDLSDGARVYQFARSCCQSRHGSLRSGGHRRRTSGVYCGIKA